MEFLVMLGPPGAGKGTLSRILSDTCGFRYLAMGDVIRSEMQDPDSAFGQRARPFMEKGEYLPDSMALELFASRVGDADPESRWLLDGFPRTLPQGKVLEAALADGGDALLACVALHLDPAIGDARIRQRRVCLDCGAVFGQEDPELCASCGGLLSRRDDDAPGIAAQRLAGYEQRTTPLLDWYRERELLLEFDAVLPPDLLAREVLGRLQEWNVS